MTQTILRLDASARTEGSVSRAFADAVFDNLHDVSVTRRDLADGIPHLDAGYVSGTFKQPDERANEEVESLALSNKLLGELMAADTLVISTATYNFNIPSSLKAWIDQVTRAGIAFRYTENGPEGLLKGKRAVVLRASAGTPTGAENDFATPYLRFILGFIGITDVSFFDATRDPADADIDEVARLIAPAMAA